MSNKKGFVFIETIVTIVVLAVSLLYIYSGFTDILIKEKARVHYDDVAYIYRTYYVKNFFANYNLNNVLKNLSEDNPMIIIGCEYSGIFGDIPETIDVDKDLNGTCDLNCDTNDDNYPDTNIDYNGDGIADKPLCMNLVNSLGINKISVALNDLSYIQECNLDNDIIDSKCSYLKNFSAEQQVYLNTLGKLDDKNKYVMIIEYKEPETTEYYIHNYAWVRI